MAGSTFNEKTLASLNPRSCSAEELGIDSSALQAFTRRTGPLAVVDLETTGLPHERGAELLEFGAVLVEPDASIFVTLESLVAPRGPIPKLVQRLTGMTDADVADAPGVEEVAPARGRGTADLMPKLLAAIRQLIALGFLWPIGEAEARSRAPPAGEEANRGVR